MPIEIPFSDAEMCQRRLRDANDEIDRLRAELAKAKANDGSMLARAFARSNDNMFSGWSMANIDVAGDEGGKMFGLDVGCGPKKIEIPGYTMYGFDGNEENNPDILGDIRLDLARLPDKSVDLIWCNHVIEHVRTHEVHGILVQFHRLLKDGGLLLIAVPDLEEVAKSVAKDGYLDRVLLSVNGNQMTAMDLLYGYERDVKKSSLMQHQTGFTKLTLTRKLTKAGFKVESTLQEEFNLAVKAIKVNYHDVS